MLSPTICSTKSENTVIVQKGILATDRNAGDKKLVPAFNTAVGIVLSVTSLGKRMGQVES